MSLCIVILRCVRNEMSNVYWKLSSKQVRKMYPEAKLVVIDDNSDYTKVSATDQEKADMDIDNIVFVQSEHLGRGELLPYAYFLKHKWADYMLFIHDSVFMQSRIDLPKEPKAWYSLWNPNHRFFRWLDVKCVPQFESLRFSQELTDIYWKNREEWLVNFGAMCYISFECLSEIQEKYGILNLVDHVLNRQDRQELERVMSCLHLHHIGIGQKCFMDEEPQWDLRFPFYKKGDFEPSPFVKVFTGR